MKNVPKELDFTDEEDLYVEIPVTVPNEEEKFVLFTISGANATRYQNTQSGSIVYDSSGRPIGVKNIANLEPLLLSMSLKTEDGKPVSEKKIGRWPFPIQRKLFETAQTISKLGNEAQLSNLVYEAFQDDNAPCSLGELRNWLDTLDKTKFKSLRMVFSPGDEETVKNS